MCSICRNKNCKYQFGKEKWGPPTDDLVVYELPAPQLPKSTKGTVKTFIQEVRELEEALASGVKRFKPQ